ncbi:hypothetical protein QYE76_067254 [Lolium multiflorum]|uniref:CCHC-type domain-containing protein n=1 Tax=Lolium multiflorum TaxID=4521 RepID=A0AAD8SCY5_LOLMU|nr:hypothetical protein QYE76_067254 [Lolium multiflorum]
MTGHAKKLSDLGIVIPNRLGINRVLQSLPPSYKNFVMNYNMQNMNKEFPELFGMLKAAEIEIKKEHQVLMVNKTTSFKKQGKSKGKNKKSGKKAATPPVKPKSGPKPDAECYYCKEKGHWKRNCSKYLADLKSGLVKKKKEGRRGHRAPIVPTPSSVDYCFRSATAHTCHHSRARAKCDHRVPCSSLLAAARRSPSLLAPPRSSPPAVQRRSPPRRSTASPPLLLSALLLRLLDDAAARRCARPAEDFSSSSMLPPR